MRSSAICPELCCLTRQPPVAAEHWQCGWSEWRHAVSVQMHTNFKDLVPKKCLNYFIILILLYTILDILASNKEHYWGFPGGAVVKNPPANAGDMGSSPGQGRSHMPRSS